MKVNILFCKFELSLHTELFKNKNYDKTLSGAPW